MAESETPGKNGSRSAFYLQRIHSLSGALPLGLFLVEHLWTNSHALDGQRAFISAVGELQKIPFLPVVEIVGILLPLLFHSLYGVALLFRGRMNALGYNYSRNWLYVLQRVSGIVSFAFIGYHLWEFRVQKAFFGMSSESFYDVLCAHLSSTHWGVPWMAFFYLAGIAATVFHFANGLSGFCLSWGMTISLQARRRLGWVLFSFGLVLFLVGANTVVFLATGARVLPTLSGMM